MYLLLYNIYIANTPSLPSIRPRQADVQWFTPALVIDIPTEEQQINEAQILHDTAG